MDKAVSIILSVLFIVMLGVLFYNTGSYDGNCCDYDNCCDCSTCNNTSDINSLDPSNNNTSKTSTEKFGGSNKKSLVIGRLKFFPPFWYENDTQHSHHKGVDAEFSKELSKRINRSNIQYKYYNSFDDLYSGLKNKEVDVAVNNLWSTKNLDPELLFSIPYYVRGGLGIMFLKNKHQNDYVNFDSMKGKKVGALIGVTYSLYDSRINDQGIIRFNTPTDLWNALANGQIDFAIEQYTLMKFYAKENGLEDKIDEILIKPLSASVVSTNPLLHKKINEAVLSMWNDGSLLAIKNKYLLELGINPSETLNYIFNCP